MRHTKIIATLGPASSSAETIAALIAAGAEIFRLNFSHGTQAEHLAVLARVRAAASRAGRQIAVLQDLAGPKVRIGPLAGHQPVLLEPGRPLRIVTGEFEGDARAVSTSYAPLARSVRPGDRLLLADGAIELRVERTTGTEIETTVIDGGLLGEHKGINAPDVPLPASAVTAKDADDLRCGLAAGVDMVAVSFVQRASDLQLARRLIEDHGAAGVPLVAKIERPQALEHLDEILDASDAVMVARGDLGLEMPLERVPRAQKETTRAARRRGIPVILATQVLESMTKEARPTRAEVTDAAYAVDSGVDAIMLSPETAIGDHPVRAVEMLDAIVRDAELGLSPGAEPAAPSAAAAGDPAQALCEAAVTLANRGDAEAIVAVTRGGGTARRLSALRPRAPIFATSDRDETARRLALYRGVVPVRSEIGGDVDAAAALVGRELVARGLVRAGAVVVFASIHADLARPDANYLKLQRL